MSSRSGAGWFDADAASLHERRSAKWRMWPADVLPSSVAEMDFRLAPCISEALLAAVGRDDCGYAFWDVLPELFAGWSGRRLGWTPEPGSVVVLPDVVTGIGQALRLLTEPGDPVVIMPPVYPPFWRVVLEAGRRVVEVPLVEASGWRLDLDGVADALQAGARAVLLCSPHNPVGAVWPRSDLEHLAGLAERHGALVISDEIHAPLTLPGARFTSYGALGAGHAVVVTSPSKAFNLAGLKCAMAVGCSAAATQALRGIPLDVQNTTGHLGVLATEAALRDGDGWLDALLGQLDGNRRLVAELLATRLPQVRHRSPAAGYLAWLDCRGLPTGGDPADVFLRRGRVALASGPSFGAPGSGHVRLNFGTSPALVAEAVERIVAAI